MKRGPFVTEDYGEILLPTSDYTYNESRKTASEYAGEFLGDWGRSRYGGRRTTVLHTHDEPWSGEIEDDCEPTCTQEAVWSFYVYEGTHR